MSYYGRYPVPHLTLRITPFSGHGVRHGMTFGMHGGFIKIGLGSDTTKAELMNDWMLTHEMIHLAFPSVADEHHWIEEGISTYVEPIARIRASHMKEEQMWADLIRDMPKGQPQAGDEGLDRTHTWGRTYWGGALFCFDADVEIRRRTQNKKGLQDALRGILDAGGNITNDWDVAETFKIGDKATGVTVLTDLYNKMRDHPMPVDLAEKWEIHRYRMGRHKRPPPRRRPRRRHPPRHHRSRHAKPRGHRHPANRRPRRPQNEFVIA